jgi:hypothetical protein
VAGAGSPGTGHTNPKDIMPDNQNPIPNNRAIKTGTVKVRARGWIAEPINGQVQTFKPGEVFEIAPDRVKALGQNVEPAK